MDAFRLWEEDRNPSIMLHIKTIAGNCLAVTWHCWPLHHCAAPFQISHLWESTLRRLYNSFHEVHYCIYHHSRAFGFYYFTVSWAFKDPAGSCLCGNLGNVLGAQTILMMFWRSPSNSVTTKTTIFLYFTHTALVDLKSNLKRSG